MQKSERFLHNLSFKIGNELKIEQHYFRYGENNVVQFLLNGNRLMGSV